MTIPPPIKLRCEYLENPLGVDVRRPRLSWVLTHPVRSSSSSAARVIVASSRQTADDGFGDLWDTGLITEDVSCGLEYSGVSLHSFQQIFWRVQWGDNAGNMSSWSEIASFEMGFLEDDQWQASWITKADCREHTSPGTTLLGEYLGDYINAHAIYCRREFMLAKPVKRARAFVSGLGFCELSVNGQKVGDRVLDPAQTDYSRLALYSTYDIVDQLAASAETRRTGRFVVGMILGNGRHIRNYGYGHPRGIVQILVEYIDGSNQHFVTDGSWKVSHGALQQNGLYFGERYDARLEEHGWDEVGADDSSWSNATEVSAAHPASQLIPPIRVARRITPVHQTVLPDGTTVFDFGENCAGWLRVCVKGERGTELTIHHAELLHDDGALNTSPNQAAEATDVYILKGDSPEWYEPRFTYHGFRYASISASPVGIKILSVEGCVVHSDVEQVGTLTCSNALLNRIHANVLRGQLSNLMSIPTDCCQRDERHGWLGDAHLAAEESMFNFNMAAFYTKFLKDIALAQRMDGSLPDVVPPYTGRLYPADPAWSSAFISIAWEHYQFYGEKRILDHHFDAMKKYVDFLKAHSTGLVIETLGKYGDWCPPGSIAPKRTPVELTSTWYFYHDALLLSRIAGILCRSREQQELEELSAGIKDAFNRRFLRDGEYLVNRFAPVDRAAGQTSNLLPLHLKMVPEDFTAHVLDRLLQSVIADQDFHLDTGILGTKYILDVLTDYGHAETAYKVASQRTYPGWGYMVEEGATTLWERWEKITGGGMNSQNHIMLGSVDAWFYRVVAGISVIEPGWKRIGYAPPAFAGLTSASASVETVRGVAALNWKRDPDEMVVDITVPVGSQGIVRIPLDRVDDVVEESDTILWGPDVTSAVPLPAVTCNGKQGPTVLFTTGSGSYHFHTHRGSHQVRTD
ncbi:MAG TPA: family 78 glycoside hydrolase catalytic domain [Bacteroidota bacterium]|nr:family 78 glycoside hydrolase catalytic domain [Bacteroidota bacterium]